MKKICVTSLIIVFLIIPALGQNTLDCLQGVYKQYDDQDSIYFYDIFKGDEKISMKRYSGDPRVSKYLVGFVETKKETEINNISMIQDSGTYFITYKVNSLNDISFINIHWYFLCDNYEWDTQPFNENEAKRISRLPYAGFTILNDYRQQNNIDYIQEFLDMTVKSICVDQLDVFNAIDGNTIGYLVRDDLVEVLDTQGDWVQVKFLKTDVVYWTYMSCLE